MAGEFRSGWRIYNLDQQPGEENGNRSKPMVIYGQCNQENAESNPAYPSQNTPWGVEIYPPHLDTWVLLITGSLWYVGSSTWKPRLHVVHTSEGINFKGQKDSEMSSISEQTRDKMKHMESMGFVLF